MYLMIKTVFDGKMDGLLLSHFYSFPHCNHSGEEAGGIEGLAHLKKGMLL
jgi:hypothetical protein